MTACMFHLPSLFEVIEPEVAMPRGEHIHESGCIFLRIPNWDCPLVVSNSLVSGHAQVMPLQR
jgi:hypothetical protein